MFTFSRNCMNIKRLEDILNINFRRSLFIKCKLKDIFDVKEETCKTFAPRNVFPRCFSSSLDVNAEMGKEKEICFSNITKGDEDLEHKLKVLMLEAEVMRQEGRNVPPNYFFTERHWEELLNLPTRTARKKYFEYLFKISQKKANRQLKKQENMLRREEYFETRVIEEENSEDFALKYDLQHNNMLLRVYDTTINQMYNNRLIQAIMFGQKLVVDCGYEDNMTKRENLNCAKQLMLLFADNRMHEDPFDMHFCNINVNGPLMRYLQRYIPPLYEKAFPLNTHECSYLDIFPKEDLVYLTPHCREEMTEFDHNSVYIVGAIVDKINNEPLSLAKAKREGIRMAKFPLDRFLQWGAGSGKSLTLNQVTSILNDVKLTGNWTHALRHVPKRKLVDLNATDNINKPINNARYERRRKETKWVMSSNVDLENLRYNKRVGKKEKERLVKMTSILNDDK